MSYIFVYIRSCKSPQYLNSGYIHNQTYRIIGFKGIDSQKISKISFGLDRGVVVCKDKSLYVVDYEALAAKGKIVQAHCGKKFICYVYNNNNDTKTFIVRYQNNRGKTLNNVTKIFSSFNYPMFVIKKNGIDSIGYLYKLNDGITLEVISGNLLSNIFINVRDVKDIISLTDTIFLLTNDGKLYGHSYNTQEFKLMNTGGHVITKISGISNHAVALASNGNVFVWGSNDYGQIGLGRYCDFLHRFIKLKIENIVDIAAGNNYSMFVDSDGHVWATGMGTYEQILINNASDIIFTPTLVPNLEGAVEVSCGWNYTIVKIDTNKA